MTQAADYWNHNVHYQPVILNAVPPRCGAALDVGCGDGLLACKLAARCRHVTGIDADSRMVALARERARHAVGVNGGNVAFVQGDFREYPFAESSFDFVCANTSVHHMGTEAALAAMARVLRPGGRLAVLGLGRGNSGLDVIAIPLNQYYQRTRGEGHPGDPKLPPDVTWAQVREIAARVLPGARYRRHLLWRYSLSWEKPRLFP
jgi:ubiquinone/menaquinone biosynthesis C-methylase UbiE